MLSTHLKTLSESTRSKLKDTIHLLEPFLNHNGLLELTKDDQEEEAQLFYKGLLSDLRHLLVFSEVCDEKLGILLRRPNFDFDQAGRLLYETYHQCVNAFFYPRNECYYEDGRLAYTGLDSIRYRYKPNLETRELIQRLSQFFQELRDELSYYENDYMTQRRMQGQK